MVHQVGDKNSKSRWNALTQKQARVRTFRQSSDNQTVVVYRTFDKKKHARHSRMICKCLSNW